MPAYAGKFQYLDEHGSILSQGACQVGFDAETCTLTPPAEAPLAFDLGDIDRAAPGEWDLALTLYTGRSLQLRQFGAAFGRMSQELMAAWRDRTVRCLMLEDLEEIARFNATAALGTAPASPAEIRLYRSNLAILPSAGLPFQWRLADVDSVRFDSYTYSVTLTSGAEKLEISKLAKKTEELRGKLEEALDCLHNQSAGALHQAFPFLDPDQLQNLVRTMPEGRSVPLPALASIHPKLPEALVAGAVDEPLQPYFDGLRSRAGDSILAGFKFIRPDEEKSAETAANAPAPAEAGKQPLFFWFFFPIAGKPIAAWESTTGSGRATYFFRTTAPVEQSVAELTRGLALVNFRREPVYLSDDTLERQPLYHRYAIGCRKLPALRALRAAMLGRAIHSSPDEWRAQVDSILR